MQCCHRASGGYSAALSVCCVRIEARRAGTEATTHGRNWGYLGGLEAVSDAKCKARFFTLMECYCELGRHTRSARSLERVAVMLMLRGRGHFDDADLTDAVARVLNSMTHQPAAYS